MRKSIIFIFILSIAFIVPSSLAGCWTCTQSGSACTSTCDYSRCTAYQCFHESVCTCSGNTTIDMQPPILTINSPANSQVYGARNVYLDLGTNELAKIQMSADGGYFTNLCDGCRSYKHTRSFIDGQHTLIIKAIDLSNNEINKTVSFTVDSYEPRISKTLPENNAFANGIFTVEYTEYDLTHTVFHYKASTSPTYTNVPMTCESGERKLCSISINISPFENQQINYYFTISDSAHNLDSEIKTVKVDTRNPVLTLTSPINGQAYPVKNVLITASINEPVLLESSTDGGSFKRLCSNCVSHSKTSSFNDGQHTLIIRATDAAGNQANRTIQLATDSKKPIIKKIEPDTEYANSVFTVEYKEDSLKKITLHYKSTQESNYHNAELHNCQSSNTYNLCSVNVNIDSYDGQEVEFYFTVEDVINSIDSDSETIKVDVSDPVLTIQSPEEKAYSSKMVQFSISTNEEVTLDYSTDNENFKTLCRNCITYNKGVSIKDGQHSLEIRVTDKAGNAVSETLYLSVDTKEPSIKKTEPVNYASGIFTVYYTEEYLTGTTLYYGTEQDMRTMEFDCEPGKNKACTAEANLSDFEGEQITYYFALNDQVYSTSSEPELVLVDTIAPTIELGFQTAYTEQRIPVVVELSEIAKSLKMSKNGGSFSTLCMNCDYYSNSKYFSLGSTTVTIQATDYAGNSNEQSFSFVVS